MDHVAAAVIHGGAGTTATVLRAGVPCTVVPYLADQPFWGKRTEVLGVGAKQIPRAKLTAAKLAATFRRMTTDQAMRDAAAKLAERIRTEDGAEAAVAMIESEAKRPFSRAS
jgi:sterol 3beta-glucosyltransferase